jgi:hypothetical protein
MKILALSVLTCLAIASVAHATASPVYQSTPDKTDARAVLRFLQVARGYETCVLRCEDRYQACLSAATSDDDRRSCRLDHALCESDCGRFGSR